VPFHLCDKGPGTVAMQHVARCPNRRIVFASWTIEAKRSIFEAKERGNDYIR
jgi:hypothetical protein